MATAVQGYSYALILLAVKERLAAMGVVSSEYAYIGRTGKALGYPTERWLRIVPGSLPNQILGAGRQDTRIVRPLSVEIFSRFEVDVAGDSTAELTNGDTLAGPLGHLYFEEQVANALHMWVPMSSEIPARPMVLEPMRFSGAGQPPSVDSAPKAGSGGRFVTSTLQFETVYFMPLTIVGNSFSPPSA